MLTFLCFLLLFRLCSPNSVGSSSNPNRRRLQCHEEEGSALLRFKQSFLRNAGIVSHNINDTGIDIPPPNLNTESWIPEDVANCCYWAGVECDNKTGYVISLNLSRSLLFGSINKSSTLFQLVHLQRLHLSFNHFNYSQIPMEMGSLSGLTHLNLSYSALSGPIPNSIFRLESLENLGLEGNYLNGTVELDKFMELKGLRQLGLSGNSLSVAPGSTRINASLPQLIYLRLSSCNLSNFPRFLQGQNELQVLELARNNIDGVIPSWVWNASAKTLLYLDLSHNSLREFERTLTLERLRYLNLKRNKLQGTLPPMLCSLKDLQSLDVSYNNLNGTIPDAFKSGNQLRSIYLSENKFSGQLPRSLAGCTVLEILDMGNNCINDMFPSWLGAVPELQVMVLRGNQFHGYIGHSGEAKHGDFPKLRIIDLSRNKFSGSLPAAYFRDWNAMKISSNNAYMWAGLQSISVNNKGVNILYLNIPANLTLIDLSHNRFSGLIPESIGDLRGLHSLNLSGNTLTGSLPPAMGNLSDLESLDVSHNKLSGHIPDQLTKLTFLAVLNVSYNQLSGPIPNGRQFDTFQNSSYAGNSWLCGNPLSKKCHISPNPSKADEGDQQGSRNAIDFDWAAMCIGYAGGLVAGLVVGSCLSEWKYEWLFVTLVGTREQPTQGLGRVNIRR